MCRICCKLIKEVKENWPKHLTSLLIGLVLLGLGYLGGRHLVTVNIAGHKYEVESVFEDEEFDREGTVKSKPISIGTGGGHFSISFRIATGKEKVNVKIKHQLSYDGKIWLERLDSTSGDNVVMDEELTQSKWYYCSLSISPAAYIKFFISVDSKNSSKESPRIDMKIFKHM